MLATALRKAAGRGKPVIEPRWGTTTVQPPILLINLDRATDRLAFVDARLRALGLHYTRIAAVDGGAMSEADRQAFASARPRDGKRGWRPGQIGCFLSHMEAWRRAATAPSRWTLVLEDDLHVSDFLPQVLHQIDRLPAEAEVVRLESTGQWLRLDRAVGTVDGRAVRRVRSAAWGAGAYLITAATAARLAETDPQLHSPADDFLFNPATSATARALSIFQVVPALASQDKFSARGDHVKGFGSDIETDLVNARLVGFKAWRRAITSSLRGKTAVGVR